MFREKAKLSKKSGSELVSECEKKRIDTNSTRKSEEIRRNQGRIMGRIAAELRHSEEGQLTSNNNVVTLKSDAETILTRLGIPMSTAIDMFLNQVVLVGGILF